MLLREIADGVNSQVEDLARKHGVSAREIHSQLIQGIQVEKEHTADPAIAQQIALDHLAERPDYYTMLKSAESKPLTKPPAGDLLVVFLRFVMGQLKLDHLPPIEFAQRLDSRITTHPTFGYFDPETDTIRVSVGGRHIMDVFRTLAHELVHHKQRLDHQVQAHSGDTGSDQENQANALAGVLMRDFADLEPESFGVSDVA